MILDTTVTRVTEDPLLFAMQQPIDHPEIVGIGRSRLQAVDQAQRVIDGDVNLHPEVSLLAFPSLVHLRVTLSFLVLDRTGRINDAGIDNRGIKEHQHLLVQVAIDLLEDLIAQLVALQKVAQVQDDGLVRQRIRQLQAREQSHGLDLIQGIFHSRIGQVVEQLHAVDPQHRLQRIRRMASITLWITLIEQHGPRDQGGHPLQELLAPHLALLVLIFQIGKAQLVHRNRSGDKQCRYCRRMAINS